MERTVLAYSGGLDTSVAVPWLREEVGYEVVALVVDVGQGGDLDAVRQRALDAGAVEAEVADARADFAERYVVPAVRANGLYEGRYPLVSALARPVIAERLVEAARRHGAGAVAHGCTGKGNDQVRFEVSCRALAPDLDVLAPVRTWGMNREDCIRYAVDHGVEITASPERLYSIDENLWGRTIECGPMEDPWATPPADVWERTRVTSSEPADVVVAFEEGVPVAVDGERMAVHDLVARLDSLVGGYGWGRVDMVENRRVGIKSREAYECPGSLAVLMAHADLESITLERDLAREKQRLEPRWAELVYDGLWFSPLREALDAFMAESQRHVTGEVRLHLEPSVCRAEGRRSPVSLYDHDLATYGKGDAYEHHDDAAGFVRLWGLGVETWAARQARR